MAATGKVLGTVTSVVGEAKATAADGTVRILQVGDVVRSDETITTSAAGAVNIALENGKTLDCGANSDLSLHESILGVATAASNIPGVPGTPAAPGSVEALQAAIQSGQDPSQIAPATAAGGAPAAGGAGGDGSGGTPVVIEQANTAGVVEAGFPTGGGSIAFPTPEFQLFPPTEPQPTVSVSVQVQVEVGVTPGETPGQVTVPTNPVVSTNAVGIVEGTGGETPRQVNFVIKLSESFDTDVQVTYQIVSGPANPAVNADAAQTPSDYTGVLTATITIPAGATEFVVPVMIVQDHVVENNENFSIILTNAQNATIDPSHNSAIVTIQDDDTAPVAHADTNWTQEDAHLVATGNVIAGQAHAGAPSGSFADAQDTDADGDVPHVTTAGTFNGTYGTLVLNVDGTYVYTLNNASAAVQGLDTGETLNDSFNYTASDGFNAPSSATLTVTIFGSNDTPTITVRTDPPGGGTPGDFSDSAAGVVNEAALASGSTPSSDAEFVTGSLRLADADGLDDIQSVTVNGTTVTIGNLVGSVFHGSAGDMTITSFSGGIANFSYELKHAVTDVANQAETDVFTMSTSDGTASSNTATVTITIIDDVPSISVAATQAADALIVDETNLAANATANFADNFTSSPHFNADGAGSVSSAYSLSLNAGSTGLVDTATGQAVTLQMSAGKVQGVITGGVVVFEVSVDTSGNVTLDQQRAVVHSPDTGPDQPTSLSSANLVVLTRTDTITDADGDSANGAASINIGTALTFKDDAPSITVSATQAADSLTVDESDLSTNASANFADNFGNAPTFGADGAGSVSSGYALSLNAGSTGLVDSATGQAVTLQMSAGKVQGVITGGVVVFEVSVDTSGNVTLDQQRAVMHTPDSGPDQSTSLASANLVVLTRTDTITDKDGDTSQGSASINIGTALHFEDDAPSVQVTASEATGTLTVDESDLATNATTNFAGDFVSGGSFGADGPGSVSNAIYTLSVNGGSTGLVDTATNQAVTLAMNGGAVEGRVSNGEGGFFVVFKVSVDGSGNVTLDQQRAVVHSPDTGPDQSTSLASANLVVLTRSATITDADGDTANSSASINIGQALHFEDDAPSVNVSVTQAADTLTVDETSLATNATANFADNFSGSSSFGADGAGTLNTAFSLSVNAGSTGLVDTATGEAVTLQMSGGKAQGVISGGVVVFEVSVSAGGQVTLDQQRAVMHTPDSGPDQSTSLASANLIVLTRTDTITDKDGDASSSSASIDLGTAIAFKDDAPSINVGRADVSTDTLTVDETVLATDATANFADNFNGSSSFGADGAGTQNTVFSLSIGAGSTGLVDTATNQAVTLSMNGGAIEGRVSNGEGGFFVVFRVSVDTSGNVTLDQQRAVMHTPDSGPDQNTTLASADLIVLTRTDTITDKDGDSASDAESINIGTSLNFHDDAPSIDITGGDTSVIEGQSITNGTWTSASGADAPATTKVLIGVTEYNLNTGIDTGKGTLTVNSNGTWTFAAAPNQVNPQSVTFSVKITDKDLDSASDSHTITINDGDNPGVTGGQVMTVNEAALSDGSNPSLTTEVDATTLTFTSGSDAITSMVFGSVAGITISAGGLDNLASITWSVTNGGRTLIGTMNGTTQVIQLDLTGATSVAAGGSTGNVTVTATLLNNFLHENAPDADSLVISGIQVVGTDTDGDKATHTFTGVTVLDDAPSLSAESIAINHTVGHYSGNYTFADGADDSAPPSAFGSGSLVWTNKPSDINFAQTGVNEYTATFVNGGATYFVITVKNDSTYDFNLVTPPDSIPVSSGSLFSGITGGSNLPSFTFGAEKFGGAFELVLTASDNNPGADTITISSTELGINGNSIQEQFGETLKLDVVQQAGFENATVTKLFIGIADTGSLKTNDDFQIKVTYKDASTQIVTENYDGSGVLDFNIDPNKVVNFVEFSVVTNNTNFKVTGITLEYDANVNPDDDKLDFTLTAHDGDGDTASANFSVNVLAGTAGNDILFTGNGADSVSGGAGDDSISTAGGNDILIGGAGHDTLIGGLGSDTYVFQGPLNASTSDFVTGFNYAPVASGGDVLDLHDVLPVAAQGHLDLGTLGTYISVQTVGPNTVISVDADGGGAGAAVTVVTLQGITGVTLSQLLTNNEIHT